MSRLTKYNYILYNLQLSKNLIFHPDEILKIKHITVNAGHFKSNSMYLEHCFIFAFLTASLPAIFLKKHGKREKPTLVLQKILNTDFKLLFIDRLVNIIFTSMHNIDTIKVSPLSFKDNSIVLSLKQNFEPTELYPFLTERILSREIFMPLSISFCIESSKLYANKIPSIYRENILRMYRIPVITTNTKS